MKNWMTILLTVVFTWAWHTKADAQCSGRYWDEVFPDPKFTVDSGPLAGQVPDFTKIYNYEVTYGSAEGQTLKMFIFPPDGDDPGNPYYVERRPLIVLAYGGSFTAGVKFSPDIINLCQAFTARGFVTASIDYRLNAGTIDSATMLKQVVKAVQDAKAAIRYFYKDAKTTDTYRIDTNKIFMGGTSAGAFIGVHLGYLTDTAGIQQWMKEIIESQGGLEGNSGNPGYSSRIAGVINLAGAIGDTAWMKPGAVPMVSMQGNDDGTVPYCSDIISVSGNDLVVVDGCGTIKRRTAHLGIENRFYTWRDAGHVPYVDPRPTTSGPAYMDTTVWFIRDFLYEQMKGCRCDSVLWAHGNVTSPYVYGAGHVPMVCGPEIVDPTDAVPAFNTCVTGITPVNSYGDFSIYPNPSYDEIYIKQQYGYNNNLEVQVFDDLGRTMKSYHHVNGKLTLHKKDFGSGLFIVKLQTEDGKVGRAKIIFQ